MSLVCVRVCVCVCMWMGGRGCEWKCVCIICTCTCTCPYIEWVSVFVCVNVQCLYIWHTQMYIYTCTFTHTHTQPQQRWRRNCMGVCCWWGEDWPTQGLRWLSSLDWNWGCHREWAVQWKSSAIPESVSPDQIKCFMKVVIITYLKRVQLLQVLFFLLLLEGKTQIKYSYLFNLPIPGSNLNA